MLIVIINHKALYIVRVGGADAHYNLRRRTVYDTNRIDKRCGWFIFILKTPAAHIRNRSAMQYTIKKFYTITKRIVANADGIVKGVIACVV